jgi:hypothetical protein
MTKRFFVIPVAADGSLPNDLAICESEVSAILAAVQRRDRHAGIVIAVEPTPFEEQELVRVIGRVKADVLASLVV